MDSTSPITVLGAGAWGTALAILLARNRQIVRLWDHDPKHASDLYHQDMNTKYLPDIAFPENLEVFSELAEALTDVEDILIAVPSHGFRDVIKTIRPLLKKPVRIVWGTKGIDPTGVLLHEVVIELLGDMPLAVLAGPSFAKEVALDLPTAVTLAHNNENFAHDLVTRFRNQNFRVYTTEDMIGVQICGAVKNVLAIAVGINDGLGLGANSRCALITRGLAEMARLGIAMGAKRETFMGLAGVGDLVMTTTDDQSRNRRFGIALGTGKTLGQAKEAVGKVVEGMNNAERIHKYAQRFQIEMPITGQVCRILQEKISPLEAVKALLSRDPRAEEI